MYVCMIHTRACTHVLYKHTYTYIYTICAVSISISISASSVDPSAPGKCNNVKLNTEVSAIKQHHMLNGCILMLLFRGLQLLILLLSCFQLYQ